MILEPRGNAPTVASTALMVQVPWPVLCSLKETEERKGGGSIKDHRVSAACLKEPRSFSQEKRRLREPRTGVLLAFSISTENTGIQGGWKYFLGSY